MACRKHKLTWDKDCIDCVKETILSFHERYQRGITRMIEYRNLRNHLIRVHGISVPPRPALSLSNGLQLQRLHDEQHPEIARINP